MNKKRRAVSVLLAVILLLSMSSCSSSGVEYYTNENGTQYLVVRDSDGNLVINENDMLQVYVLNENGKKQKSDSGEYITEYIEFNGQVVEGRYVETKEMTFTLPSNFEEVKTVPGFFSYESAGGEIYIDYYSDNAYSIDNAISGTELSCENLLESFGSEVFSYEKYTQMISGIECTAFKHECISSEYYKNAYFFYIPYDSGYYSITCNVDTDYANKVDFEKFINSVVFK